MPTAKTLWIVLWKGAFGAGFGGIGVMGVGLLIGVVWYQPGIVWGILIFLLGLMGILLALGAVMTIIRPPRPRERPT